MPHLIAEQAALHFIHHYQRLLVEVVAHPSFPKPKSGEVQYLALLTQARGWMLEHPHVLQAALAALRATAHYRIFLPVTVHEDAQAYAVK